MMGSSLSFLQDERSNPQQIEEKLFKQLHAQAGAFRRTLLTSLIAPHSSDHLTVLPTEPAYRIVDSALRLSVRHRLGLAPPDSLSKRECVCKSHTAFAADPDHLHSCLTTRGSSLNQSDMTVSCKSFRIWQESADSTPSESQTITSSQLNQPQRRTILQQQQQLTPNPQHQQPQQQQPQHSPLLPPSIPLRTNSRTIRFLTSIVTLISSCLRAICSYTWTAHGTRTIMISGECGVLEADAVRS